MNNNVTTVCDPVLLLSKTVWNETVTNKKVEKITHIHTC